MPASTDARPAAKGVGFSDDLIVLGDDPIAASPAASVALPKAHVFVRRGEIAVREMAADVHADHPANPRNISSHFEHTVVHDDDSAPGVAPQPVMRPPGNRRARFFQQPPQLISDDMLTPPRPYDEPLETSCTDSEEDALPSLPSSQGPSRLRMQNHFDHSTKVNTKLNSLPSGGAFSLMNSSEDVDSSSTDDEELLSSRKMIRVDGSAKLSSASGLGDDSFHLDDDDEFAIDGAEPVDEEEAVNVRSFGRSFARVRLKEEEDSLGVVAPKPRAAHKSKSGVSFDVPEAGQSDVQNGVSPKIANVDTVMLPVSPAATEHGCASQEVFACSKSVPPRRKSRLRLTFVRRASLAGARKHSGKAPGRDDDGAEDNGEGPSSVTNLSCFPMRKTTTKTRLKTSDAHQSTFVTASGSRRTEKDWSPTKPTTASNSARQVVVVPEIHLRKSKSKGRKMVKNISMQRDDWIDFTTNASHKNRTQWLSRLVSSSGDSSTSSKRGSRGVHSGVAPGGRESGRKFWKFWSRK